MKLIMVFMALSLTCVAQEPPKAISVISTSNEYGGQTTVSTYMREDVERYNAIVLGTDYKTYRKAMRNIGHSGKATWKDSQGYEWSRSGGTVCRLLNEITGSCISY